MKRKQAPKERGTILLDEQVNRLGILLEQIDGCADLMFSHVDLASDGGAMTALNVIKEKAAEGREILSSNHGPLTPIVLAVRDANAKAAAEIHARAESIAKQRAEASSAASK